MRYGTTGLNYVNICIFFCKLPDKILYLDKNDFRLNLTFYKGFTIKSMPG